MAFNGSGSFSIETTGNPVVDDTDIDATVHNATMTEIAAGLSGCITRDGQSTVSANIPMNTKKFTGLGAGSALTDSASLTNTVYSTGIYAATVGGTVDAITLTPSPAHTAYTAGQQLYFIASGANTGATTVNVSGLGVKSITKGGATALAANDILSAAIVHIMYDGTRFQKI